MARIPRIDREETLSAVRQRLLDAAALEFALKGFADANINRISLAAGFSKGTVYNYFPSKQALALSLVAEAGGAHVAYIACQVTEDSNPARRLERFFESGFRYVEDHPAQARFLITTLYGAEIELREAMGRAYLPLFDLLAREVITPGVAQGLFRPVDPQAMAVLLMTLYLGTSSQVDQNGKAFLDPRLAADFALHALLQPDSAQTLGR